MTNDPFFTLLKTSRLTVGYGKQRLFEDLDLSMKAGDLICFMGRNGVGKSTLIRTLAGLQKPLSGTVELPLSNAVERQISVVLTDRMSATNMTVTELISYGRYPYLGWNMQLRDEDRRVIDKAIDQVRIGELTGKQLYELSDGQLQMVMIARALAQDTPIILLDEPTAHLDLNNRLEVMNLLRRLARHMNKAILVATHELDLALQTADLVWLAGNSGNITTGIPEDLVLSGAFDEIFQFKGFDLRTGKVQQEVHRSKTIMLKGESHAYLWTRNALERNGYAITDQNATHTITVDVSPVSGTPRWTIDSVRDANTLKSLLEHLNDPRKTANT